MIKAFLVDDHPLVRMGLKWVLESQDDIRVIGEAGSGKDALSSVPRMQADVVLCDFRLPDLDGLEVIRRLLKQDRSLRILIISVVDSGPVPRQLLAAGALGYVSKARDGQVVVRAVREVAAGRRFLDDGLAGQIFFGSSPFDRLSARELEVALMIVKGRKSREISRTLGIAEPTVRTLKFRLLLKLGLRGEVALTRLAMDYGVIGPARD